METQITLEKVANPYASAVKVMMTLERQGFTADLGIIGNELFCSQTKRIFQQHQFTVIAIYRFESEDDQNEGLIIYAIECLGTTKGILLQIIGVGSLTPNMIFLQQTATNQV